LQNSDAAMTEGISRSHGNDCHPRSDRLQQLRYAGSQCAVTGNLQQIGAWLLGGNALFYFSFSITFQ
jgi:hypothetical protein